jgi:hypothetical protein
LTKRVDSHPQRHRGDGQHVHEPRAAVETDAAHCAGSVERQRAPLETQRLSGRRGRRPRRGGEDQVLAGGACVTIRPVPRDLEPSVPGPGAVGRRRGHLVDGRPR